MCLCGNKTDVPNNLSLWLVCAHPCTHANQPVILNNAFRKIANINDTMITISKENKYPTLLILSGLAVHSESTSIPSFTYDPQSCLVSLARKQISLLRTVNPNNNESKNNFTFPICFCTESSERLINYIHRHQLTSH